MSTQEYTTNTVPPERGLSQTLQMTIVEQSPDRVVMTMPVTAYHLQPWGYLHGGASIALAETAATLGAFLNCPPDMVAFGQEINANHLRPVREGMLTATATRRPEPSMLHPNQCRAGQKLWRRRSMRYSSCP